MSGVWIRARFDMAVKLHVHMRPRADMRPAQNSLESSSKSSQNILSSP